MKHLKTQERRPYTVKDVKAYQKFLLEEKAMARLGELEEKGSKDKEKEDMDAIEKT